MNNEISIETAPSNAGLQGQSSGKRTFGRPWLKGTSGNPSGRRKGSVSLKAALMRTCTKGDCAAIARALVDRCKGGDIVAIRTFAQIIGEWSCGSHAAVEPDAVPGRCVILELPMLEGQDKIDESKVEEWRRKHALALAQQTDGNGAS